MRKQTTAHLGMVADLWDVYPTNTPIAQEPAIKEKIMKKVDSCRRVQDKLRTPVMAKNNARGDIDAYNEKRYAKA